MAPKAPRKRKAAAEGEEGAAPKKRAKSAKEAKAPKAKVTTAWQAFCDSRRATLKAELAGASFGDVSKARRDSLSPLHRSLSHRSPQALGAEWTALDALARAPFAAAAAEASAAAAAAFEAAGGVAPPPKRARAPKKAAAPRAQAQPESEAEAEAEAELDAEGEEPSAAPSRRILEAPMDDDDDLCALTPSSFRLTSL